MRDHRVDESSKLPPDKQMMHDLREGLKLAHAPATLTLRQVMTRGQKVAQVVLPKDLHQAFRYGILVEHEAEVTDELTQALEWLKGRLG